MTRALFRCVALALLIAPVPVSASRQDASPRQDIEAALKRAGEAQSAGRHADMESIARDALERAQAAALPDLQVRAMLTVSAALFIQSRIPESLAIAREAEPLAVGLPDPVHRGRVWNQIAVNLRELGEFEEAAGYFRRGLELHRASGNHLEQARVLRNLSMLYNMLGDFVTAEDLARATLAAATTAGDLIWQQIGLEVIGIQQMWQGREDEAIRNFRRAQAVPVPVRSQPLEGEILANMAVAEFLRGNFEASQATARASLALTAEYPAAQALMRSLLGKAELKLGRPRAAVEILEEASAGWRKLGPVAHRYYVLEADVWMVRALRALGEDSRALALNERLLVDLEHIYGRVPLDETSRATARASLSESYVAAIDMLLARGRVGDAFDLSERYRARAFIESLTEWRGGAAAILTDADRLREEELSVQLSTTQRSLWALGPGDPGRGALDATIRRLEQDRDAFRLELRRRNPALAALRYPALRTAGDVQRSAEPGSVTLSFVLGEERSFVWALSARGLSAGLLPGRAAIERAVERFTRMIAARPVMGPGNGAPGVDAEARRLYRMLLGPIETAVGDATRLIVIPDGVLHHVPFEALKDRAGRYLVTRASISVTPSATALATLETTPPAPAERSLLAFADPATVAHGIARERSAPSFRELTALPYTRSEARAIASTFPSGGARVHVGGEATEEALKRAPLERFRYLHFATHAFADDVRPGRSAIVLASSGGTEDGLLQPAEIMALKLDAGLVTLSACGTGLGRVHNGEGIVGLARAFFYAGARSVTASLWNVNDAATATLMQQFYAGLHRGDRKDEALRAAKQDMIAAGGAHAHPYYWAPFVLLGSSR